jgi:hypothetical protein
MPPVQRADGRVNPLLQNADLLTTAGQRVARHVPQCPRFMGWAPLRGGAPRHTRGCGVEGAREPRTFESMRYSEPPGRRYGSGEFTSPWRCNAARSCWRGRITRASGDRRWPPTERLGNQTFDPSRVGVLFMTGSVGGGHKKRALAHGYSMDTPSGLRASRNQRPPCPARNVGHAQQMGRGAAARHPPLLIQRLSRACRRKGSSVP